MEQTPIVEAHPPSAKRYILAVLLAAAGTVLVGLPVVAPFLFSLQYLAQTGKWQLDYLIPAEWFPLVLAGTVLLIVAALLAHSRLKLIGGSFALAIGVIVAGQALATATGLASGETEPVGLPFALVLGSILAYDLLVATIAAGGVLLLMDLVRRPRSSGEGRT